MVAVHDAIGNEKRPVQPHKMERQVGYRVGWYGGLDKQKSSLRWHR